MSKEVKKTLSSVEEIPEDSLDQLVREGALDHCFEPREEFPKLYKPWHKWVEFRRGDLTQWTEADAIVHQCNCLTVKAHGLSAQIAMKYPWGNVYFYRRSREPWRRPWHGYRNLAIPADRKEPGTIQILRNPGLDIVKNSNEETHLVPKKPDVIVLYAQWDFGKGGYNRTLSHHRDTPQERERWFAQCLEELGQCDSYQNLAFPYQIGCGLAGGYWSRYLSMIQDFAAKYKKYVTLVGPLFDYID